MHDLAPLHERESEKHLMGVRSDGLDVKSNVLTEPLDDFPEVEPGEQK
jgi:hypothetical protein